MDSSTTLPSRLSLRDDHGNPCRHDGFGTRVVIRAIEFSSVILCSLVRRIVCFYRLAPALLSVGLCPRRGLTPDRSSIDERAAAYQKTHHGCGQPSH